MTAKHRDEFIKDMVADHRPAPPLLQPGMRSLLWFAVVMIVTFTGMHLRQEFRPGFVEELVGHPAFLIEVASAFAFTLLVAYAALVHVVPGRSIPRWAVAALWIAGGLFAAGLIAEFTHLAPESSGLGGRPYCHVEVFIFGGAGSALFYLLARRGWVRFSWRHGIAYGIAALVPSTVMQLACLYSPVHNLLFHFLPAVPVLAVGFVIMKRLASRGPRD